MAKPRPASHYVSSFTMDDRCGSEEILSYHRKADPDVMA